MQAAVEDEFFIAHTLGWCSSLLDSLPSSFSSLSLTCLMRCALLRRGVALQSCFCSFRCGATLSWASR
eukprot:1567576-Rhodomonas_salina.1